EVEPAFIRFVVVHEGGHNRLMWESANQAILIPYQYFSEGTLRFLAYAVLFSSKDLPEVIVIDDIDTALDDTHIEVLMQIVRDAGKRTNILLTTRSAKVAECAGRAVQEL
ncbi:MAG TPA: AAA family ATPase, partial [Methanocorpusculum sp.]|nr:AAA family ATPase [Methanocorpusculum sp.]